MENDPDIELTCRALKACGYRIHVKERCGTRWVTAVKGLDVQYRHWHPLTNINQAMQLLIDAPDTLSLYISRRTIAIACSIHPLGGDEFTTDASPQALIAAKCRAIVTACASFEPVR